MSAFAPVDNRDDCLGCEVLGGVDVLSGRDVVDSSNAVGAVEAGDKVDFEELDCDDEISCSTTAAIKVPFRRYSSFYFHHRCIQSPQRFVQRRCHPHQRPDIVISMV
jgi:hypothetical protein